MPRRPPRRGDGSRAGPAVRLRPVAPRSTGRSRRGSSGGWQRQVERHARRHPSANVSADSPTTRSGPRHDRATASAFAAPTPMMRARDPRALRTVISRRRRCRRRSARTRHRRRAGARRSRARRCRPRPAAAARWPSARSGRRSRRPVARNAPSLVEVAAALFDLGAIGAHRGVLLGVVALGDEHGAADAVQARRQRNRLAVVAGARRDDAARPLVGGEGADEVQPAADLEGAGRVGILVLDPDVEAQGLVEQRCLSSGEGGTGRDAGAGGVDVLEGGGIMWVLGPGSWVLGLGSGSWELGLGVLRFRGSASSRRRAS